ncbi:MAG: retron St85 family effector protein [Candidatus Muiribacteriota bacterium]
MNIELKTFATNIDLKNIKIKNHPSFILLCGGEISYDSPSSFKSCRDIFFRYIADKRPPFKNKIILVEKIFNYFSHSEGYSNLLDFEKDLAELCALTVLFSESPGSIAEFGAFSVLETIREKLLIVMHEDDSNKESFIWRGPASYLKDISSPNPNGIDPISIYSWKRNSQEALKADDFTDSEDLCDIIENATHIVLKSKTFNKENNGHKMLMICDILKILQIATIDDIHNILSVLEIKVQKPELKRFISLLSSLEYIKLKPYGNYTFYIADKTDYCLDLRFKDSNFDKARWQSKFSQIYLKEKNSKNNAKVKVLRKLNSNK